MRSSALARLCAAAAAEPAPAAPLPWLPERPVHSPRPARTVVKQMQSSLCYDYWNLPGVKRAQQRHDQRSCLNASRRPLRYCHAAICLPIGVGRQNLFVVVCHDLTARVWSWSGNQPCMHGHTPHLTWASDMQTSDYQCQYEEIHCYEDWMHLCSSGVPQSADVSWWRMQHQHFSTVNL